MSAVFRDEPLRELLAEVEGLATAVRAAAQPLPPVVESCDRTGAVTVTLEDHGRRVTRVVVASNWRDLVAPEAFGAAVMEAVLTPRLAAVRDFLAAVNASADATAGSTAPAPAPFGGAARTPAVDWDELGRMVATVRRALDTVAAGLSGPARDRAADGATAVDEVPSVEGVSANRRVVVRFVAGQLAEVAVDERWLVDAGRQQIADSLREAFEAAYAAGADESAAAGAGGVDGGAAVVGELREILDRMGAHLPRPEGGA
ncbi:MAG: hypothetical protein FWJ87_15565 [Micromonosporaceae bacterium]